MPRNFQKVQKIDETHSLRVSARGEGYCLYLPRGLVELYGLLTGDKIKAHLTDHFRPVKKDESKEE